MSWDLSLGFVAATVLLVLLPGPDVALIVADSMTHGPGRGLVAVAGASSVIVLRLVFTILGPTVFLAPMAAQFERLRRIGDADPIFPGLGAWRAPVTHASRLPAPSARGVHLRGLPVPLADPKTLLFCGAVLPPFVVPEADQTRQPALPVATF